jgi:predicted O-methyltransferase YrrM
MLSLDEGLQKYFRFYGEDDSLPFGVKGRKVRQDGRELLAKMMRDMGFHTGIEIGTQYGLSAELWYQILPDLQLTCIDPYGLYDRRQSQEKQDATYEKACNRLRPYNALILREKSLDIKDRFADGSVDFVHIDGDHAFNAVVQDIIYYAPKVRPGGLVLIHDYVNFYRGGVIEAVNAYTKCNQIRRWFVTRDLEPTAFWQVTEG